MGQRRLYGQLVRSAFSLMLMCCYAVGSLHVENFHSLFHGDEHTVSHVSAAEADPCHRAIYHGDLEAGCDHDKHFTENKRCFLADIEPVGAQEAMLFSLALPLREWVVPVTFHLSQSQPVFSGKQSARAPPMS